MTVFAKKVKGNQSIRMVFLLRVVFWILELN